MIIFFIIKIFELDESTQKIEVRKDSFITVQKRNKENPSIAKGVADRLYTVKKKGDEIVNYCHKHQIPKNFNYKDNLKVNLGMTHSPIDSVGFYVPGGKAIYPSSVLMNAIPALVAGVERRILVSPISDLKKS